MQEYYGVELNYRQAVVGILAVVGWGIIMWLTARKKTAFPFAFQFSHGFVGGRGDRTLLFIQLNFF
jgi:hypothetical protein